MSYDHQVHFYVSGLFNLAKTTDFNSDFHVLAKFRVRFLAAKLDIILSYSSHHISLFNTLY